jgi:hypothetical protein
LPIPGSRLNSVAFWDVQVSVTLCPFWMLLGSALRVQEGDPAGGGAGGRGTALGLGRTAHAGNITTARATRNFLGLNFFRASDDRS